MKLPMTIEEPLSDLSPLLLDSLPFDETVQFTSMGFKKQKHKVAKSEKVRDGRNNIKRNINRIRDDE